MIDMCKVMGARIKSGKINLQTVLENIQKLAKKNNLAIQMFDARFIFGADHLISATEHAKRAFSEKRGHSDSLSIEVLLYASGEYQIKNALAKLGVTQETSELAFVVIGGSKSPEEQFVELIDVLNSSELEVVRDDSVITGDKSHLEQFGISDTELSAVPEDQWFELVLERVALVDLKK